MKYFWFILSGLVSGVLGGMGMGGGTILIPALTILLKFPQLSAQAINLISFLPMAIISLILHFKNKLVSTKGIAFLIVPAVVFAAIGAICSSLVNAKWLKICFGVFLALLAVLQFVSSLVNKKE